MGIFYSGHAFAAKEDKPPFYKVTWQGQQAYLLGSIHVGKADFYPLANQIEQAFEQSDVLVVEADVAKADTMSLLQQFGSANGVLLTQAKAVSAEFCQQAQQLCRGLGQFAPWLQAAQISLVRFGALGYSADEGVDARFVASRQNKPLLELESVAFQFELISSFSDDTQIQMLDEAINASDDEMLALISAWRGGDEAKLATIMEYQAGESDELMSKLLWQRNHSMSTTMLTYMEQHSTQQLFFIVGAGHLVGQQNIHDLLSKKGAVVTACWRQNCQ